MEFMHCAKYTFVFISLSTIVGEISSLCLHEGSQCGRYFKEDIARLNCCEGLYCKYDLIKGASGKCTKLPECSKFRESCGGFQAPPVPVCCEGLKCEFDPKVADKPGNCIY